MAELKINKEWVKDAVQPTIDRIKAEYIHKSVIEDIKAEIQEHTQRYTLARENCGMGHVDWSDYLIKADDVIKIIDKHTSGEGRTDE